MIERCNPMIRRRDLRAQFQQMMLEYFASFNVDTSGREQHGYPNVPDE